MKRFWLITVLLLAFAGETAARPLQLGAFAARASTLSPGTLGLGSMVVKAAGTSATKPWTFAAGDVINASKINDDYDTLYTAFNNAFNTSSGHTHDGTDAKGIAGTPGVDFKLNSDLGAATAPTENATITVERGSSADVAIKWDEVVRKTWQYTTDGTNYVEFSPLAGYYRNLRIWAASLTTITINADALAVKDASSGWVVLTSVNVTDTITGSGANGIDAGAMANNTLYYVYVIYNPTTGTVASLISLASGTIEAPTMPAGYTYRKCVGFFRSNGSAQIFSFSQSGNHWKNEDIGTGGANCRVVNGTVPNSANWQTANLSGVLPAGFGRMHVGLSGWIQDYSGVSRSLHVGNGGSFLGNTEYGSFLSYAMDAAVTIGPFGRAAVMTDGTINQQIRWKISVADATAKAYIDFEEAWLKL